METILLIDTEFIDLNKPFVYDVSYTIARVEGGKYEPLKIVGNVVKQIYDNKLLFATAYYKDKKPLYSSALRRKVYEKKHYGVIINSIINDIKKYNVNCVMGYNVSADMRAIAFTSEQLKVKNPFENVEVIDLMPIVINAICDTIGYKTFAKANNLITKNNFYKFGVEAVAKYVYNKPNFIEKHMGLSDNEHELNLLNKSIENGAKVEKLDKKFLRVE
jgi:hypothetical protein